MICIYEIYDWKSQKLSSIPESLMGIKFLKKLSQIFGRKNEQLYFSTYEKLVMQYWNIYMENLKSQQKS